ncbi:DUF1501 domain-containing protein [Candidatus Entotheonella palauensis]|uniref:DUF1501 domain-containing protein n=1 Tax=Candidatus Entotheonella palauensis TaxID=93172 RepID=UPI0015C462DE
MTRTTRRGFLKQSGFMLLTIGVGAGAFHRQLRVAESSVLTRGAGLSGNGRTLVVIQLSGGNDGLNTVIPLSGAYASQYRTLRPRLAIPEADVIPLGTDAGGHQLGLHPNLELWKWFYDQGRMGVIQAVGYDTPNHSHEGSMRIWHQASPERARTTGWLGGYLDLAFPAQDNPLLSVAISKHLPMSLQAAQTRVPAVDNIKQYRFKVQPSKDTEARRQVFLALHREAVPEHALYEQVRQMAFDTFEGSVRLQEASESYVPSPDIDYDRSNPLTRALQQAAQIMASDAGTKILYVSLNGFDTHGTQRPRHAKLLGMLAEAIDVFDQDLQRLGLADDVLIMTWSEFGRKVRENGNVGTGHGAAGPQFVFGNAVNGGIFGEHPDLIHLSDVDDPLYRIDFRSYYATILERWLEVDAREVLGGTFEFIDFL